MKALIDSLTNRITDTDWPATVKKEELSALLILRDLVLGGRHSRRTVARYGISLPTADRWLTSLLMVPGVTSRRVGKTTWYQWNHRDVP